MPTSDGTVVHLKILPDDEGLPPKPAAGGFVGRIVTGGAPGLSSAAWNVRLNAGGLKRR
jgi:hypothetical protein